MRWLGNRIQSEQGKLQTGQTLTGSVKNSWSTHSVPLVQKDYPNLGLAWGEFPTMIDRASRMLCCAEITLCDSTLEPWGRWLSLLGPDWCKYDYIVYCFPRPSSMEGWDLILTLRRIRRQGFTSSFGALEEPKWSIFILNQRIHSQTTVPNDTALILCLCPVYITILSHYFSYPPLGSLKNSKRRSNR